MRDGTGEGQRGKSGNSSRRSRARRARAAMSEPLERRLLMAAAHDHGAAMLPYLPAQKDLHEVGGYLTRPSNAPPLAVARSFLATRAGEFGATAADVATAIVTDQYTSDTGIT